MKDRDALIAALRPLANADIDVSGTAAIGITAKDIVTAQDVLSAALSARPYREAIARPSDDDLDTHLPERLKGAKRCGIQRSVWLDGWFIPWSPRNDNENAEGPWSDWVALAHAIIAADEAAILALDGRGEGNG